MEERNEAFADHGRHGVCEPVYSRMVEVMADVPQRSYFCFHDYAYRLDVTKQKAILPATVALEDGLAESFAWYLAHPDDANRRDDIGFIDRELAISR